MNGKWLYRVKWQDFDAKHNSWVQFSDLNKKCQEYVTDMHDRIFTDRKSQKKQLLNNRHLEFIIVLLINF